jgi:hypothetical protein
MCGIDRNRRGSAARFQRADSSGRFVPGRRSLRSLCPGLTCRGTFGADWDDRAAIDRETVGPGRWLGRDIGRNGGHN